MPKTFSNSHRFYMSLSVFVAFTMIYMYLNVNYKLPQRLRERLRGKNTNEEQKYNLEALTKNTKFLKLKDYIDKNTVKLKVYIGDFKSDVNDEGIKFAAKIHNYGYGGLLDRNVDQSLIHTYPGDAAADFIFHQRITNDRSVLVNNLTDANVVYVPLMLGSLVGMPNDTVNVLLSNLTIWLKNNEDKFKGKLILFLFSHLENIIQEGIKLEVRNAFAEQAKNLYLFTIEESPKRPANIKHFVLPYPSITKFALNTNQIEYNYNLNENRLVDTFFCGNARKSNIYRKFIFDNVKHQTSSSFTAFKQTAMPVEPNDVLSVVYNFGFNDHNTWMAKSKWEDKRRTIIETNEWKRNSKLCLEPFGDTHTRRSFWDSVMHGCIPVVFTDFKLPFEVQIDYRRFVIRLDKTDKTNYNSLLRSYLSNKVWMKNARNYMQQIRQFLQYSWPFGENTNRIIDTNFKYDAYGMILAKLAEHLE